MSQPTPQIRMVGECTFSVLMLAISLGILYVAYNISGFSSFNSPGAFPIGVGLIALISALKVGQEVLSKAKHPYAGWANAAKQFCAEHFPTRTLVFLGLSAVYLFIMKWVSFYISTFLFLVFAIVYLRSGRMFNAMLIAGFLLLVIYLLFTLAFSVYLP